MSLKQNTSSLQEILDKINALPGTGGVELPELTNEGKSEDLRFGKQLIDSNGDVITGSIETFDGSYECSGESTGGIIVEAWTGMVDTGNVLGSASSTLYYLDETLTPRMLGGDGGAIEETITIAANTLLFFSTVVNFVLTNAENITSSFDLNNLSCTVIRPTANNFSVIKVSI